MRVPGLGARERAAALVLGTLLTVLAIAAPAFFSPDNLRDVVMANAAVQIIALGMTLVVLTGEVDVSVGATFAVCAVVAGHAGPRRRLDAGGDRRGGRDRRRRSA